MIAMEKPLTDGGEPQIPLDPLAGQLARLAAELGSLSREQRALFARTVQLEAALRRLRAEMEQLRQNTRRELKEAKLRLRA